MSADPFEPVPEPAEANTPLSDELEELCRDLYALRHSGHPEATRYVDWDDVEERMRALTEAVFTLEAQGARPATKGTDDDR